ncbi:MAG: T9SS type B sorting domain-containing protein [Saprospiraceae bacterium]
MKNLFTLTLFTATVVFLFRESSFGQCNGAPCTTPNPQTDPANACILSDQNDLSCYTGATTADTSVVFPTWCGDNVNTHWFAFTADTHNDYFAISVSTCDQGSAVQAAIFSTSDCVNFSIESPCVTVPMGQNGAVIGTNLVPGEVYYLCIGGDNGAICNYTIDYALSWGGYLIGCVLDGLGLPYNVFATDAVWSVDPPSAASFDPPIGAVTDITWLEPGIINLCVNSSRCPEICHTVEVFGGVFEEHHNLCEGGAVSCGSNTFTAPGTYTVTELDENWPHPGWNDCAKTITCHIHLIPTIHTSETVYMCQNSSVTCAGEEFSSPGSFPVTFIGPQGCDSIVTCNVNVYPITPATNLEINLCGPAEYEVCNFGYNSSGIYTQICTNWLGCDSIINLDLAILDPHAVIEPPGVLSCQINTITLNGSNSSANNAFNGSTSYNWSGPGIIGSNSLPTIQVNQAGTYCLELIHWRGSLNCRDTACVQVTSSGTLPALSQITGNINPCLDSTYIYSVAATGSPAPTSFNWTIPGNLSFTTLSPDSIRVTWDTIVSGPICVTATNTCGPSQPACQPIIVQTQVQQPAMNGPNSVCIDSSNYLFTLNLEQPGVLYNWTIPTGAVLTGSGDTVHINFLNSISGQVCVTPQNACGAGMPVCQMVQVNSIPTADLSSDAQICAGESVNLNFSLTGNGPFDINWTINNQSFTLNDIPNGHVLSVNPSQTTVYKLTNISDNSSAACSALLSDSVTVTVWQGANTALAAQICSGESLLVGGGMQTTSGIYTDTLQTFNGCDSLILTTLTVLTIDTTVLSLNTCDPALAGSNTLVLTQLNGCDSVVITLTTLQPSDTTLLFDKSCDVNNVGVFTQNLSNVYGCDSMVVTTVIFSLSDTTLVDASTCDPAAVGVFNNNLLTIDGCDSLVITTVNLLPGSSTMLSGTTCNPAQVGVFINVLTNQFGCDSVVVTTVNLLPGSTTMLTGTSCNPTNVGVFTNVLSNYLGCDSTVITTVALIPLPTTILSATSCDPASAGVFTDHFTTAGGCDSTVVTTVTLLSSSTTTLTGSSCNPANVGVFTNILSNYLGCDSTVITTVSLLPSSLTSLATTTCDPAQAGVFVYPFINQFGCDSVVTETRTLLPTSMTTIDLSTCDPTQVGSTTNILPNQFGCDSTIITQTSLLPVNSCSVAASLSGSDIPCLANTGILTLTPIVGIAPFSYTVQQGLTIVGTGTITTLGTPHVITGLPAGNYTVNVTSPNGFSSSEQATVVQLMPPALTSAINSNYAGFDVSCTGANDGSALAMPSGGTLPYTFSWSNGGAAQQIDHLAAGVYSVTVFDANGCTNVSTVALTESAPLQLSFIVNDLDCFDQNDGAIQVQTSGGAAPYRYSLNNGPEQPQNIFTGLNSGLYTLTALDANDCQKTDVIVVNAATPINVDLGDEINIGLGDQATLLATVNVPLDSILSVVWTPPFDSSECPDPGCLTQVVTPFVSTVYNILVQALNGCTAQDKVTVIVDRRRQIYVPNVFTPNEDGTNDLFTIYAKPGSVSKILSLQVFDRWGEALITLKDFLPNNPTIGWDGSFNGEPMNPGVFVWVAEIEFIDGQRELFKGDVTVVR